MPSTRPGQHCPMRLRVGSNVAASALTWSILHEHGDSEVVFEQADLVWLTAAGALQRALV